jgi:hypothetical protein
MKFIATNYAMGRSMKTIEFEASSLDEARRIAETQMPSAHGLPGTGQQAAATSRIIGIKYA